MSCLSVQFKNFLQTFIYIPAKYNAEQNRQSTNSKESVLQYMITGCGVASASYTLRVSISYPNELILLIYLSLSCSSAPLAVPSVCGI